MSDTYTRDFNRWVQQTTQCLRERRWQEVDVDHLIEEIEDLGKSEKRGIAGQLTRLLFRGATFIGEFVPPALNSAAHVNRSAGALG